MKTLENYGCKTVFRCQINQNFAKSLHICKEICYIYNFSITLSHEF